MLRFCASARINLARSDGQNLFATISANNRHNEARQNGVSRRRMSRRGWSDSKIIAALAAVTRIFDGEKEPKLIALCP
jgi:hypothetical protein